MTQYNGTTLAYIGDAVYEVIIREHLLNMGFSKVENLHNEAIKFTSAVGQKKALRSINDDNWNAIFVFQDLENEKGLMSKESLLKILAV